MKNKRDYKNDNGFYHTIIYAPYTGNNAEVFNTSKGDAKGRKIPDVNQHLLN